MVIIPEDVYLSFSLQAYPVMRGESGGKFDYDNCALLGFRDLGF